MFGRELTSRSLEPANDCWRRASPTTVVDSSALIALAQAIQNQKIQTEGSILFVGTVGEEGEGNLRGVRHLVTRGRWASKVDAFLSFDGPGVDRITNRALGSRRYRVEITGPGGHSWGDFGLPNPVHALSGSCAKLAGYPLPREPRTTFNVGHIEGGTSVNAIPEKARWTSIFVPAPTRNCNGSTRFSAALSSRLR